MWKNKQHSDQHHAYLGYIQTDRGSTCPPLSNFCQMLRYSLKTKIRWNIYNSDPTADCLSVRSDYKRSLPLSRNRPNRGLKIEDNFNGRPAV